MAAHEEIEVLERDADKRPTKVRQVVKIVGIGDEQVLDDDFHDDDFHDDDFHDDDFHDDGVSWSLVQSKQQRAQEGRYSLTPDGDATVVRLDLTVDLHAPLPGFRSRRAPRG